MNHKIPHNAPAGFDWLVKLEQWAVEHDILSLQGATAQQQQAHLTFRAITPTIWRFTFAPLDAPLNPPPFLINPNPPLVPLQVSETDSELQASTGEITLRLARDAWFLRFEDAAGEDVLRENPADIDGLGKPFVLPLGFVKNDERITAVTQAFHLRPEERLYGLGEKFTPLNKMGQRIISWTQDAFGSTSERSHKNIPFLMSTRGYGLLLNTGARITWDIGTISCQSMAIMAEDTTLDMIVIFGSSFASILNRYADITGRPTLPPKWTFGLWVSSGGTYRDQQTNQKLVEGLEQHHIPADVVHLDPWWMTWRTYCDFRWNREAFPDVEGMIADWRRRGLKLCLWEHPYISIESDLFEFGKANNYFVKRPDGAVYVIDYGLSLAPRPDGVVRVASREHSWNAQVAIVDLTHPQAYAWFQDLHRPLFKMGVDVFKTDFGEDVPQDAVFYNGQTGATMHNLYPLLYNQCVYEVTQQERGYGVVWSRAGTAGNQRYPICWSGDPAADFASLACTIRGGLSLGFSGVPFWSNDIGGYRGMPSPHVYIRWAQFGLFCSHSRMHGDSPREPWVFGDEALTITRRYIQLRYQLFPYFYSAAHHAVATNMPVIRAMPLAFPDDINAYDKELQFMLGDEVLVAPIYDEKYERSVYFPEGAWVNYHSGEVIQGAKSIKIHAPLDHLPLFIRAGAVIPMMPPANRIPEGRIDPLILSVYPAEQLAGRLLEDDGITEFSGTADEKRLTLRWSGVDKRRYILRFQGVSQPTKIDYHAADNATITIENWHVTEQNTLEIALDAASSGAVTVYFL